MKDHNKPDSRPGGHPRYTCPMHPEIVKDHPDRCPKCGMDLVQKREKPGSGGAHEGHAIPGGGDHSEHHRMMMEDFRKRFWLILPVTLLVVVLSPQVQQWFGLTLDFPGRTFLLFLLGSTVAFYGGWPFFIAAKQELASRNWGMMTLVSLAVGSGYLFSVASTFLVPAESFYWEIATLVLVFLFGHWMEMKAVLGTGGALKELAALIPSTAHKVRSNGGKETLEDVPTASLQKGDLVLVKPGEKVPADGVVVEGESSVNEAMLTGESRPVEKKPESEVIGGAINNDGSLRVRVTKTGEETTISQIMQLIRQAQETKPNVQKLADRAANWLTVIAVVVGTGTFVYWSFINPAGMIFAATLAITVVVIACPHALGLAIPTVTTITSALAARNGILIRDMRGLEIARQLDYVIFDKTGTLTEGKFGVSRLLRFGKLSEDELLRLAASVELHSQHSIAEGIVEEAKRRGLRLAKAMNFKSVPGKGAIGSVDATPVAVGNLAMLEAAGIDLSKIEEEINQLQGTVATLVWVAVKRQLVGVIALEDRIREESKEAVTKLHSLGVKVAMLTGDKREVGELVGKQLGIDTVFSEVLPDQKVEKIKELQGQGLVVAMVGDGVNDAPSLTQAHVGIAIGAGTSVAIESAEVILVKNNPLDVVKVIDLSRKTDRKMKQNLAWATGYNTLAIPAAAGVFASFGILLRPEWGALLMSMSSIIVVANALTLKKAQLTIQA